MESSESRLVLEKYLNQLYEMYTAESSDGLPSLITIGQQLRLTIYAPRKRVNVMIIGNHSSGKSSYINWYMKGNIVKTGVAIETQGFTLVTKGKMRETLSGSGTLRMFPYLKTLEKVNGVIDYVGTELVPSSDAKMNLVTMIDTPGLADGVVHYPFDISSAVLRLAEFSDLIFVFFDPIGQALCKRTLDLVERLTNLYPSRMRFFLSKADEAGDETDRQKVMIQIAQEVFKRQGLNQCGFEMPTIYLPNHTDLKKRDVMCNNEISKSTDDIDRAISMNIQNTFDNMDKHLRQLNQLATNQMRNNWTALRSNLYGSVQLLAITCLCLLLPISVYKFDSSVKPRPLFDLDFFDNSYQTLSVRIQHQLPEILNFVLYFLSKLLYFCFTPDNVFIASFGIALLVILASKFFIRFDQYYSWSKQRQLSLILESLRRKSERRERLFTEYLHQMIDRNDV